MKKIEFLYTINYKRKQVTFSPISAPFSSEFGHVTSADTSEKQSQYKDNRRRIRVAIKVQSNSRTLDRKRGLELSAGHQDTVRLID